MTDQQKEQLERFGDAVERKNEEAKARSEEQPGTPTAHGSTVDGDQPGPTIDPAYEQDVASPRDKNSGHGKKTADKWNQ